MGTTEPQCLTSGCCWKPVDPNPQNVPWCYKKFTPVDPYVPPADGLPFNAENRKLLMEYFLRNIDVAKMTSKPCSVEFGGEGQGGIVASPDCNTGSGGSYVYAWMRDSALTMKALNLIHPDRTFVHAKMKKYANWILKGHQASTTTGIDIRTEPKLMLPNPGVIFTEPWCRPQNDGPGLQAIAMIEFANQLLDMKTPEFISEMLWTGDDKKLNGGIIKHDLNYVANFYYTDTCDLWEEIRNPDFFWNKYTMRRALILGSAFAKRMGDQGASDFYNTKAKEISDSIMNHWNGSYVYESQNRPKDSAVIIAFNEAYNNDEVFKPSSIYVASTIIEYNKLFQGEYAINQIDSQRGVPGILYGRYEADHFEGGNPWVLNSAALAQAYYNSGLDVMNNKALPDEQALSKWAVLIGSKPTTIQEFAKQMFKLGDGVLFRIRFHVEKDFHLPEQIDRNQGIYRSAKDLTWSYAETLKALKKRDDLEKLLPAAKVQ